MNSAKYRLDWFDAYKGIIMFVITAVITSMAGVVLDTDFDVFSADWLMIFKDAINVATAATFSYLVKNFLSNEDGVV